MRHLTSTPLHCLQGEAWRLEDEERRVRRAAELAAADKVAREMAVQRERAAADAARLIADLEREKALADVERERRLRHAAEDVSKLISNVRKSASYGFKVIRLQAALATKGVAAAVLKADADASEAVITDVSIS